MEFAPNPANTARDARASSPSPSLLSRISKLFGNEGPSFGDVLDLVNPLQHIPVVSNLYRKITGDEIAPVVRIAGDTLYGGPVGALLSVGGLLAEHAGKDSEDVPTDTPPERALAETNSAQPYRGGWIVNAAMSGQIPPAIPSARVASAPAVVASASELPRGGWIVAQAYGVPVPRPIESAQTPVDERA